MLDKIVEKVIPGVLEKHLRDNAFFGCRQNGFMKRKYWSTSLISLYDKVIHLVDQREDSRCGGFYLSKVSDTVSHFIFMDASSTLLDKSAMHWVTIWPMGQTQRATVNGAGGSSSELNARVCDFLMFL